MEQKIKRKRTTEMTNDGEKMKKALCAVISLLSVLTILVFWYMISWKNPELMPTPVETLKQMFEMIVNPTGVSLFEHVAASFTRVFIAYFSATLAGVLIGVAFGWSENFRDFVHPIFELLRPIPPIAWIPFSIIWFGIGVGPAVFIIFMGCVFPILLSTIDGVHRTDPVLIEAAQSFGASNSQMLTEVIIPSSLPYIVSGLKIATGIALMCTISGEMIGSSSGIGYMILTSTNLFDTGSTVVGMLVIGVIGIIFDYIFTKIQERIFW